MRLFKNSNFAAANMMMFMVGAISFATTVLMPQFLQTLMGYTAEAAGMVLSVVGGTALIELPIVGRLIAQFQLRYLIAFGWITLGSRDVYFRPKMDLLISFPVCHLVAHRAVSAPGFYFCARDYGRLHRNCERIKATPSPAW